MAEQTDESGGARFDSIPGAVDIGRYFWHEVVMAEQTAIPYRRGQYHGADGITLWRDGADYCYLWVDATVDHDMWMGFLLEVRTNIHEADGFAETRDHLYLAAGAGDLFEICWRNQPIQPFRTPLDDCIDHHREAMRWFVERDVGTIEDQNGGAEGIIARAADVSTPSAPTEGGGDR